MFSAAAAFCLSPGAPTRSAGRKSCFGNIATRSSSGAGTSSVVEAGTGVGGMVGTGVGATTTAGGAERVGLEAGALEHATITIIHHARMTRA